MGVILSNPRSKSGPFEGKENFRLLRGHVEIEQLPKAVFVRFLSVLTILLNFLAI